jgi:hypothetical protein
MNTHDPDLVPKIHPATREMLPEDPLETQAFELPGDPVLMLRLLVEEYARMGTTADEIMRLARDPFYQSFHGLWRLFGEGEFRRLVGDIAARCGVVRVRTIQANPPAEAPDNLVQLQVNMPT